MLLLMARRVYKPTRPGGGLQPGTVDWELARRQARRQRRSEDEELERRQRERDEAEPKGIWRVLTAVVGFFKTPRY
jgi:hypothetical protein